MKKRQTNRPHRAALALLAGALAVFVGAGDLPGSRLAPANR